MELKRHQPTTQKLLLYLVLIFFLITLQINQSLLANTLGNQPTLLQANEISYSKAPGIITASGNVELSQSSRMLLADKVIFSPSKDEVVAEGNVILLEPDGEVLFSSKVILSNELKDGIINDFRLLLKDGSRFASNTATRVDGKQNIMKEAIFSPCHPCKEDPHSPLVWQIKAKQVVHDELEKNIEYENAVLELFDFPIFYMPYFIHPDPSVERRSGFLIPTLGHSDEKGLIYGQPYFHVIDQARDIKIEPVIYTREGIILKSHYRHALPRGNLDIRTTTGALASGFTATKTDDISLKGSVDLSAKFALDRTWRASFDLEQSSNRNYQRKFDLDTKEILTSRALLEGFRSRNYTSLSTYKFQGLRSTDDRRKQPFVFPTLNYNFIGQANTYGIRPEIDLAITSITRELGADSRKVSFTSGIQMPSNSKLGEVYTLYTSLQTDLSFSSNLDKQIGNSSSVDYTEFRFVPQIGLNWRYPLVRNAQSSAQIIEPIINFVLGPNVKNSSKISNEDSQAFEFDDTNIFDLNRYAGTDRITAGARVDYGVRTSITDYRFLQSELFLAQSYQFAGNSSFDDASGLENKHSDFVGRFTYLSSDFLSFNYRFRLDGRNFSPKRSELGLNLYQKHHNMTLDYSLIDKQTETIEFGNREQIDLKINSQLIEKWSSNLQLVQDFTDNSNRTIKASFGITYTDECFTLGLQYQREDLHDEDLKPEDKVLMLINFKDLGSL